VLQATETLGRFREIPLNLKRKVESHKSKGLKSEARAKNVVFFGFIQKKNTTYPGIQTIKKSYSIQTSKRLVDATFVMKERGGPPAMGGDR